jgi:rhodanese-related sulfurtransferase
MYTPGHTDDSYSYLMGDRVFTGDTLLIRGTGRTDFQNGSSRAQYESIFNRLLKLPEETLVFPAHDYKGDTVSTIGEEKRYNPRLQVKSVDEYIELMANLKLPNPKMMDVAVPANMHVGLHQDELVKEGRSLTARDAIASLGRPEILLVDLRETSERNKHGMLSGALHAPYGGIEDSLRPGGMLREVAAASGRRIVFFCAFGERSAMAVKAAKEAASPMPPISRAAWTPGKRPAGQSCTPNCVIRYRATRCNSADSAFSASASSTPPHSVIRSGMTMRFSRG